MSHNPNPLPTQRPPLPSPAHQFPRPPPQTLAGGGGGGGVPCSGTPVSAAGRGDKTASRTGRGAGIPALRGSRAPSGGPDRLEPRSAGLRGVGIAAMAAATQAVPLATLAPASGRWHRVADGLRGCRLDLRPPPCEPCRARSVRRVGGPTSLALVALHLWRATVMGRAWAARAARERESLLQLNGQTRAGVTWESTRDPGQTTPATRLYSHAPLLSPPPSTPS